MIRGAIFDLDGTLIDSMPHWDSLSADMLRARGIEPPADLGRALAPLSMAESLAYLREHCGLELDLAAFGAEVAATMREKYRTVVPLKDHAAAFVRALRDRNVRCCVATASEAAITREILRRFSLDSCFDFVLTCDEVGCGKDRPDIFEQALRRLGTEKSDTVIFEDSLHAVRTARAAGFRVVAVEEPYAAAQWDELRAISDLSISSFRECEVDCL